MRDSTATPLLADDGLAGTGDEASAASLDGRIQSGASASGAMLHPIDTARGSDGATDAAGSGTSDGACVQLVRRCVDYESLRNRNVLIVMCITLMQYMGLVIWQGQFLTLFLFAFSGGDSATPGYIEGTQGVVRLTSAFAAGWLVDRVSHNYVLRLSAAYGVALLAVIAVLVAQLDASAGLTWVWYVVLCLFAPLRSFQKAAIGAVFANSTTTGNRLSVYTMRQSIGFIGQVVAPIIQLVVFWRTGNTWSLLALRYVLIIGILCHVVSCVLQCFLDTKHELGDKSEAAQAQARGTQLERERTVSSRGGEKATEETVDDAELARKIRWSVLVYDVLRVLSGGIANKYIGLFFVCINCPAAGEDAGRGVTQFVPGALGAGRSGYEGWDLTPVDLLFVMLFALLASTGVTWFVGVLCSTTAKLGCGFRRAHVILCLLIVCNIANFIFAFDAGQYVVGGCSWLPWFRPLLSTENGTAVVVPTHAPTSAPPNSTARGFDSSSGAFALRGSSGGSALASGGGSTARWYISSCLLIDVLSFIIRRSTVQGVFGVKKSLLMDHVPKKARGCWNAVDSIESSFWSGTAAVGGYVIHRWGFRVNLQIMAWGYLASLVAWCNVVYVMARHRCKQRSQKALAMQNAAADAGSADGALAERLNAASVPTY